MFDGKEHIRMHNSIAKWISVVKIENEQQAIGDEQWVVPLIVRATTEQQATDSKKWFAFKNHSRKFLTSFSVLFLCCFQQLILHQKENYYSKANVSIIYPTNWILCLLFSFSNTSPCLWIEMAQNFIKISKKYGEKYARAE